MYLNCYPVFTCCILHNMSEKHWQINKKKIPPSQFFLHVQHASTCVSSYTGCKQTHRHTVNETSIQSSLFSCTDIEIGGLII